MMLVPAALALAFAQASPVLPIAQTTVSVTVAPAPPSSAVPFVALHTYFMAPGGSDSNSGADAAHAWATPNHAVKCGDVIIAAAGAYTAANYGTNHWGAVSNCPSTSGGIDGAGGVYFAVVLCAGSLGACTVNGGSAEAFRVDQSNWAVEGFQGTQNPTGNSGCFIGTSETSGATRHHIAFINDMAVNCDSQGFATYSWTSPASGVDQTAVVGAITYNASPSTGSPCASGISIIPYNGSDASGGTHIFVAGNFGYKNINAPSGATCNTDGEGLIFDSWACGSFKYQAAAEQNVWWANGSAGFEAYPNHASCPSGSDIAQVYVFGNTSYGNNQDTHHTGGGEGELYLNQLYPVSGSTIYNVTGNIFAATMAKAGQATVYGASGYVNNAVTSPVSASGNYIWQSNPGTRFTAGGPNTDVYVNGTRNTTSWPFGANTYANPGFANPSALPTGAPNCAGYANTTDCMNAGYGVYAALTPSGGASGYGYKPPGPCAPDPYFPPWLKGIVYLRWDGAALTEASGLVTKPCGL